ncbi:hypothetical protein BN1012_Phect2357 [Candidatus Phaeomarinobacter ectocarpi]|uniref:Uncharacterized protein n=1 Tax=Candidatus Phaeomarinibacter ectocarpi TaxID=1458461 RepID=X5MMN5_9HYPH|nr:hypothetical protein BN1012_Phect2357 [Candidatus Phaeomarinobacter ectocarpi]
MSPNSRFINVRFHHDVTVTAFDVLLAASKTATISFLRTICMVDFGQCTQPQIDINYMWN